jgi:hypothetical protein
MSMAMAQASATDIATTQPRDRAVADRHDWASWSKGSVSGERTGGA